MVRHDPHCWMEGHVHRTVAEVIVWEAMAHGGRTHLVGIQQRQLGCPGLYPGSIELTPIYFFNMKMHDHI